MENIFFQTIICIIIILHSVIAVDFCDQQNSRIQLVFVQDKTTTFRDYKQTFGQLAKEVAADIEQSFPGSQFAFVAFSEYPQSTSPEDRANGPPPLDFNKIPASGEEDCYDPRLNFTKSLASLEAAISTVETKGGGNTSEHQCESSLNAIVFAAASKSLGWVEGPMDPDGKYVHKVIVLVTDECPTRRLRNPGTRRRPRLDGSDTCASSLPPNDAEVAHIFMEKDISLVGLYAEPGGIGKGRPRPTRIYQQIFDTARAVRYSAYDLEFANTQKVKEDIKAGVHKSMECEDPDPPAYNTLGY